MRRLALLAMALLAACTGHGSDPVRAAERFHELRRVGDDRGLHALLTESDREAVPLDRFPGDLPTAVLQELLGWRDAPADSASLLDSEGDTAVVVLHLAGGARDTVRLFARHEPRRLWRWELDEVRWRVSMELAERRHVDSLAATLRASGDRSGAFAVREAEAYLEAAERYPHLARVSDVEAARYRLRAARVAEALKVDLHLARSITGAPYVEGRVVNPTEQRVATLRLKVRDVDGVEETVELWTIDAGARAPVRRLTRLGRGPLTHTVERIQVY